MVDIIVQRGAGDKPGPDIIDPLMSTAAVARERGRNELDEATPADEIVLEVRGEVAAGWELGKLIQVHDAQQGASYVARITGIQHRAEGIDRTADVTLWRPR